MNAVEREYSAALARLQEQLDATPVGCAVELSRGTASTIVAGVPDEGASCSEISGCDGECCQRSRPSAGPDIAPADGVPTLPWAMARIGKLSTRLREMGLEISAAEDETDVFRAGLGELLGIEPHDDRLDSLNDILATVRTALMRTRSKEVHWHVASLRANGHREAAQHVAAMASYWAAFGRVGSEPLRTAVAEPGVHGAGSSLEQTPPGHCRTCPPGAPITAVCILDHDIAPGDATADHAGPRAGDTAPTDKSNEIGANVLRDHAGRLVPVAEFDEVLTFRAGKGITHSFHSSVVRDLLIECHTIRSEHDRLRARVAELEGVGNALAEKAQTDARVPTVHSAEALADAAVAWRSAAGAPTTAAPAAAFTDGTVPAERPLPERPWRVMADWDTVIGPFRTRGEAEYWRDRSRVAHHPNAYVEPEWAPPRAAPASDKEEAERLRWIVGRVWLALELWPGSPENAPPDHEIPGVVASLVAEAAAPTDGQAPADARPRVAVLRSDLESWFGTLEQAARETAGPLSIELAAMSGEVGYWRQQKLVAAPADDTAPWGPVTIVRRDLPADCDDTVEPDTGPAGLGWRVGRSVGRTVYAPDDELIGVMDTPDLALRVVEAVNGDLSETSYEIRAERDGLRETLAAERQRSGDLVAELRRQVAALERPVPRAGQFVRDSQDGGA